MGDSELNGGKGNFAEDHSGITSIQRNSWRSSIFDRKWIESMANDVKQKNTNNDFGNVIIITEALFWCISQIEIESLIGRLGKYFCGATFVFDMKASKEFMTENEGKMFEIGRQCMLLNESQVRKNVPLLPRLACKVMSRDTFTVNQIKYL